MTTAYRTNAKPDSSRFLSLVNYFDRAISVEDRLLKYSEHIHRSFQEYLGLPMEHPDYAISTKIHTSWVSLEHNDLRVCLKVIASKIDHCGQIIDRCQMKQELKIRVNELHQDQIIICSRWDNTSINNSTLNQWLLDKLLTSNPEFKSSN